MLLSPKEQLVEMIRLLEAQNHVFKTDPVPITKSLKASNLSLTEKLISRASRIDAGQQIAQTISTVDGRLRFIFWAAGIIWVLLGFFGLVALMQSQTVNFFYVLVSLLGVHTLMLLLWIALQLKDYLLKSSKQPSSVLFAPSFLIRQSDPVTQCAVSLYTQQLQHKGMRWYLGKISHQLWLATLTGMFFAIIFLLVVRQYNFSWQSTLLAPETLVSMVSALAWLPSKLGFAVPNATDVMQSQAISANIAISNMTTQQVDATNLLAKKWAGLLIGSVLCYGFVPRLVAWLVCAVMLAKQKLSLPLQLPYYQNLLNNWTTQVVDADDMKPEVVEKAPEATLTTAPKMACLLECPAFADNTDWLDNVLDTQWQIYDNPAHTPKLGLIDDRDDMEQLLTHLSQHKVQLLVGIRAEALPDRGMMRKLDKLAKNAQGGLVVTLLVKSNEQLNEQSKEQTQERQAQWHQALAQRNIALV